MLKGQDASTILEVDRVSLSYDMTKDTLSNISILVKKGEFLSIIGSSGCGKSSLLNIIAGFIHPTKGKVAVNGKLVDRPGPERGVVFQDLALFPWLSVAENVSFGLKMSGMAKQERLKKSMEAIQMVGLTGSEHKSIAELSGGMRQRVAIARTLVTEPEIILMDEPFSALDEQTRELLQEELLRIQEKTGMTIILVTHSIDEAIYMSDRVVALQSNPGQIKRILNIELGRPRYPELRVTAVFNQYKRQLMESLREGFGAQNANEYEI
ncbi:ABC transporter ATP-binding protein [Fodinisporobacter ferrooxydans]|uniref:ABC transporter ATP-binding protein n=1 Tax=Fodinisporobacter ferrooxydans TaxID=2901836 RepID=A0ABY4CPL1_9BACL|nr:ABC transporter ATP-binding protein [Alicyclobacillaceae bacterium MYW30-H2]